MAIVRDNAVPLPRTEDERSARPDGRGFSRRQAPDRKLA